MGRLRGLQRLADVHYDATNPAKRTPIRWPQPMKEEYQPMIAPIKSIKKNFRWYHGIPTFNVYEREYSSRPICLLSVSLITDNESYRKILGIRGTKKELQMKCIPAIWRYSSHCTFTLGVITRSHRIAGTQKHVTFLIAYFHLAYYGDGLPPSSLPRRERETSRQPGASRAVTADFLLLFVSQSARSFKVAGIGLTNK